jgi:amino acid adenylation domain-containing protein
MSVHRSATPQLHDYLHDSAERLPDKVALVCGRRRVTYAELERQSNALAHALVKGGVERGDRVVVFADNTVEAAVAFWAVLKASAVVSVVSPLTKADKLEYLLNDCRAAAVITEANHRRLFVEGVARSAHLRAVIVAGEIDPAVMARFPGGVRWADALAAYTGDAAPPRRGIDIDLAAIIYTSGSSGLPKGVMQTHASMRTAATSITAYLENTSDDVILGLLPLSFDYGLYQMIMAFRTGARLVLERSFAYPAPVLETTVAEGVTGFPGVPTIFAMMAEMKSLGDYDFSRVRYVTNTAAALPLKHIELIRATFPKARLYSMYGLTECKRVSYLPPEELGRRPGSVGIAIPNTEIWIADEEGRRLPPGQIGQIVVRGGTVMRGYWEKPEETAKKLKPGPLPGERVLHTGDLGRLDEDGFLYFVGRMDDIIKSRGEKVAPKEVENVLMNLPGIRDAAVIGVPDEVLGQAVKAFVTVEEGAALGEEEVRRHCQARLESFMVPKYIAVVPELPKTTTGKINKRGLS